MRSVGIICEYNPFHNGHLYHLNEVKKIYPDYTIILVMSASFLQRGEPSIISKWDKTKICLEHGIDLIIELPFPFSTGSADFFAQGSIELLNHLKVDYLVFGSESDNINNLINIADIMLNDKNYNKYIKKFMDEGNSYPSALSKSLYEITNKNINNPNDILGISYIKEIKKINSNIIPKTIKRTNNFHSTALNSNIVSATSIRKALIEKKDVTNFVPTITNQYLKKQLFFIEDYFPLLKYKILSELNKLNEFHGVDEGIENKIKKYIITSNSLDELINNVKSKRYTYNRLKRMFSYILCNYRKEEAKKYINIQYIRVLGFSESGRKYLNKIKKELNIPLVTNVTKIENKMLDLEFRVSSIYASILNEKNKQEIIKSEFNHPLIK